jgi:hypothetical protein
MSDEPPTPRSSEKEEEIDMNDPRAVSAARYSLGVNHRMPYLAGWVRNPNMPVISAVAPPPRQGEVEARLQPPPITSGQASIAAQHERIPKNSPSASHRRPSPPRPASPLRRTNLSSAPPSSRKPAAPDATDLSSHLDLPPFDPNEWYMAEGEDSESADGRPLSPEPVRIQPPSIQLNDQSLETYWTFDTDLKSRWSEGIHQEMTPAAFMAQPTSVNVTPQYLDDHRFSPGYDRYGQHSYERDIGKLSLTELDNHVLNDFFTSRQVDTYLNIKHAELCFRRGNLSPALLSSSPNISNNHPTPVHTLQSTTPSVTRQYTTKENPLRQLQPSLGRKHKAQINLLSNGKSGRLEGE